MGTQKNRLTETIILSTHNIGLEGQIRILELAKHSLSRGLIKICFIFSGQRILSYAVAQYDYAATATTQISLKQGDRVSVLSKTGSDKGWWKGEHCDTLRVGFL